MTSKDRKIKLAKETEALIAASIYNELDASDQAKLDKQLEQNPEIHNLWMEMRTMVDVIPNPDIEFRGDLLPALRQQIAESKQRQMAWLPLKWFAPFAVAGIVLTAVFTYGGGVTPWGGGSFNANPAPSLTALAPIAALPSLMEEADVHAANKDWQSARVALESFLAEQPGEALAAQAQLKLADLHFTRLHQYPQAYTAYEQLRENYPQIFAGNPVNVDRFNLLSEAKAQNYEPLYLLEEARDSGADAFQQLEGLIAQQPNTFLASLAVDSMRDYIAVPKSMSDSAQVVALEAVRERCSNPVAIAQVNLSLARIYAGELGEVNTARDLYQSVANNGPDVLAQSARSALEELAKAQ